MAVINPEPKTLINLHSTSADFSPQELRSEISTASTGAAVTFLGTVRQNNRGRQVTRLEYECYPEMLRKSARETIETARNKFEQSPPLNVGAAFRLGKVEVNDPSTAIAVASPHREPAFQACRFLLEEFKRKLPIWKKEHYEDGSTWIENEATDPK